MIWVRIGEINLVFPDEESMMRVLRSAGIKLEDVSIVEKRD
ncbi:MULTISPECIES: hypothetical protein [Metallosphaera]|nr:MULTISPECIES: hypothetical protein [Metallosphaera]MCY0861194.1 hypothetical protein [Metallosphaera prunae]WPX07214.1 hypothetical protein SOJ17_000968 [Metallosphaera sedula DSM 5348]BBL47021.1 hypothetical protein MJ1HA_1122 [Metallosphaera sedula]